VKIVIATTTAFHLRHLARHLINDGLDVMFMSYLPDWKLKTYGIPASNRHSVFLNTLPYSALALTRILGVRTQRFFVEIMLKTADIKIAELLPRCDVLISLSGMTDRVATIAREKYGARIVVDRGAQHVLSQKRLIESDGVTRLSQFYVDRELLSYDRADYIVVPTTSVASSFIENGIAENRIFVNNYGVDVELFRPRFRTHQTSKPRIVFVGNWSYQKGCDILEEAIRKLGSLQFYHIGVPKDLPLPRVPNFRSLGKLSQSELARVLSSFDILVLPSRQDGFGMVLLEAIACGLHVVASKNTGIVDIRRYGNYEDRAITVDPGSVASLVAGLREAVTRVRQAQSTSKDLSASQIRDLSWERYATRYRRFLEQIA
jgi:glycosyltransferase involved in cell wall biosynthesis